MYLKFTILFHDKPKLTLCKWSNEGPKATLKTVFQHHRELLPSSKFYQFWKVKTKKKPKRLWKTTKYMLGWRLEALFGEKFAHLLLFERQDEALV